MGIHLNLAVIIADWCQRYKIEGPVLMLGVQDTPFSADELERALRPDEMHAGTGQQSILSDKALFARLGMPEVQALDISDYEGADIIFDLNFEATPPEIKRRFNFIVNSGTLEHIFHVPNALANMSAMLKAGGYILHVFPMNNWVDHGFYQISPTLIFDYYAAIGGEILESAIAAFHHRQQQGDFWYIYPAPPDPYGPGGHAGQHDDRLYLYIALVRGPVSNEEQSSATPQLYSLIQATYSNAPRRLKNGGPRWFPAYTLDRGLRQQNAFQTIRPLDGFHFHAGFGWSVALPELSSCADSMENPRRSSLVVLEDGVAMGPSHALHENIRQTGHGAYSHWGDTLYFSSSDNSDPNTNGRRYHVAFPTDSIVELKGSRA